jgi:hypothetical protein
MYCQRCGTQLDGNAPSCKACGLAAGAPPPYPYPYPYPYPAYPPRPPAKQANTLALVGLVLSIFMPLAGLIVSLIARKQCIERGEDGEKMAKAGIIVGAIYCGLLLVSIALITLSSTSFVTSSSFGEWDLPVLTTQVFE